MCHCRIRPGLFVVLASPRNAGATTRGRRRWPTMWRPAWRDQVRRIADSGYSTLLMPDVQQWQPAPGPTLAVAATLADLRVGTWVYASPLRTPWNIAWEAHSLSLLTEGGFEMGIGTGRPGIEDELRQLGLPVVTPGERLSAVRDAVTSLRDLDGPDLYTPVV